MSTCVCVLLYVVHVHRLLGQCEYVFLAGLDDGVSDFLQVQVRNSKWTGSRKVSVTIGVAVHVPEVGTFEFGRGRSTYTLDGAALPPLASFPLVFPATAGNYQRMK